MVRIVLEQFHCGGILVCNLFLQTFDERFLEGILVLTMLWHFLELEVVGGELHLINIFDFCFVIITFMVFELLLGVKLCRLLVQLLLVFGPF